MYKRIVLISVLLLVSSCTGRSSSNAEIGATDGAVVGAGVGTVIDRKAEKKAMEKEDPTITRQKKEINKQKDEKDDVDRQRYHDQQLDQYLSEHQ